ncbi:UDP-N-acetylmuramoyl-tripeptide--D-alanyl-D-alanine ligase [Aliifodinibius sp. S!AR15-10]|uniref:UDP-N-acetylmuramoyl-tripeptide--D-alanyl-D- alanine ligase n=1 Tax=Aliifodinibius sp. S!AR15-10 TaxID=2950437 RepID=UPI002855D7A4|nr:UDP-N-acetylmuramoyl-tripeptide--D-alanyl-D-alanine ligase [Aliifodinibius sp. S!AR15-10]MDR8391521.1 UDP-N-acetylmuramoyl-tripeptide--D-alanyl-D-alanine ligase [Aliifodinibius sp. S!AR15-10]
MNLYFQFIELLLVVFVLVMARHTFLRGKYFLHIFQQKGYKIKEYRGWIFEHWNQRVLTPEHVLYNLIIFLLLYFMSNTITGSAAIITLSMFAIFWFGKFDYYRGEKQKKPLVFTSRMIRLSIPYAIFSLILPYLTTAGAYLGQIPFTNIPMKQPLLHSADIYVLAFGWVLADALMPFWIFLAAMLTAPIEKRVHQYYIDLARKKVASMPELTVIGITGSYGKTSTKFMIRDLLEERYSVCSTPGSYNTPMGICKVINNDLEAHHQILILEMGARYEGNIDELCDIVQPDIAVVTNVGIAHLETFGSQDAIARTKSTIVKRLNPNGKAVLNFDDPRVRQMAALREDVEVLGVGLEQGEIRASDITFGPEGTGFQLHLNGQTESFQTKLLGSHNVLNMLLAVGVARLFDIRPKTMAVAASQIEPVEHRLELKKQGDIYVIDDAFNSNPVGARNAVEILSQFKSGRRIIITPGMIELGELEEQKNREFGEAVGRADLDLVILVGKQRTKPILQGIHSTGFPGEKVRVVNSLFQANDIVQEFAQPGDVILYENDLPDTYNE